MEAGGFGVMQIDAAKRIIGFVEKPADPPAHAGQSGPRAGQHGHLRLRHGVPDRPAARATPPIRTRARFRQGHHPRHRASTARPSRTGSPKLRALAGPRPSPTGATSARSTRSGRRISTSPISCLRSTCMTRMADLDLCRNHAAGQVHPRRGRPARHGDELAGFAAAASSPARRSTSRCCSPVSGPIPTAAHPRGRPALREDRPACAADTASSSTAA